MSAARLATLERYLTLERAFEDTRMAAKEPAARRLAAVGLVTAPGDPKALATETVAFDAQLGARLSRRSGMSDTVRLGLAAALVKQRDAPDPFLDGLAHAQDMMAALGLRRHEVYEVIAYTALRSRAEDRRVTIEDYTRVREIYEAMKVHHYFLTGPEDLPWCALLASKAGTPAELAARADAIYQVLLKVAAAWRWDPLQSAGNMLALGSLAPETAGARLMDIARRFEAAGYEISSQNVDEFAMLCFPDMAIEELVARVVRHERQIHERLVDRVHWLSIPLAANLTFIQLADDDLELQSLADAKVLLDLMTMVELDDRL